MKLGRKNHTLGDTIRYVIDYSNWLEDGETLAAPCTVALTTPINGVTISGVTHTPSQEIVFVLAVVAPFDISANQTFTLQVVATNSRNEVKTDQCEFFITAT